MRLRVLVAIVLLLGSCSSTRYADQADDLVEISSEDTDVAGLGAETWCSDFGDAGLERAIDSVWTDNMQLKSAWARLRQARALERVASSALYPQVGAGAQADYSNRRFGGAGDGPTSTDGEASWELSAAASYEVDLWGRHRHRAKAAEFESEAVESEARALAITLTSTFAESWFDIVAQRERLELLQRQLDVSVSVLELIRVRLRTGAGGALDVAQQQQNVESIRGRMIETRRELELSQSRLAVLTGRPPGEAIAVDSETLPEVHQIEGASVPANLVERRPDVRSAFLMLQAADERTAAAVADQLPRLQLTASIGFQAEQIARLFENLFWQAGVGATQTIYEGGRLRAQVELSEARAEEQMYLYANSLLTAIQEVTDALAREDHQITRIESLENEESSAESALELARRQFRSGAGDYLRVLTALETLQQVERSLLEARRAHISHRVSLCRALGGSWVESVEPSIPLNE